MRQRAIDDDTEAVLAKSGAIASDVVCHPNRPNVAARHDGNCASAGDVRSSTTRVTGHVEWLREIVEVFEQRPRGRARRGCGPSIAPEWNDSTGVTPISERSLRPRERHRRSVRGTADGRQHYGFNGRSWWPSGDSTERLASTRRSDVCLRLAVRVTRSSTSGDARPHSPAMYRGAPLIRNRRLIARATPSAKNAPITGRRLWRRCGARPASIRSALPARGRGSDKQAELGGCAATGWGLAEGLGLGLFAMRATRLTAAAPPPSVSFGPPRDRSPLSICLLSRRLPPDAHAGGIGRYTYDLARGLHELGHRVTILTESDVATRREGLEFEVRGVRSAALPPALCRPRPGRTFARRRRCCTRLDELVRRTSVHVICLHWGEALGVARAPRSRSR